MIINNNDIDIDSLKIKDVIDIDLLQKFQDMFSESMDFASIIVDKNGNPVTKPSSYTSFCNDFIHSTDIGKKDVQSVISMAEKLLPKHVSHIFIYAMQDL